MLSTNTIKKPYKVIDKTKQFVKKEYLKNKNISQKITTEFLVGNKRPTFLYYLYTIRKRELESKKKFSNSFLTQFKNSYKWTHFFLQKINSSNLRKFYIAKKPFFRHSSYSRYLNNKYLNNVPLLWIAKNLYWKVPLYQIHELLGINSRGLKKENKSTKITLLKNLNDNLMPCFLRHGTKESFSYFYKFKQKKTLIPYSFVLFFNNIILNAGFLNYYPYLNFYEKNKLVSKRSNKFPLNYLISKKYPSFVIVNYSIFSFCITKNFLTTPSFQLKVFLKNFIYYPIWYKSSFIY